MPLARRMNARAVTPFGDPEASPGGPMQKSRLFLITLGALTLGTGTRANEEPAAESTPTAVASAGVR
jgi:hypothetical protein